MIACSSDLAHAIAAREAPVLRRFWRDALVRVECERGAWRMRTRGGLVVHLEVKRTRSGRVRFYEDASGVLRWRGAFLEVGPTGYVRND